MATEQRLAVDREGLELGGFHPVVADDKGMDEPGHAAKGVIPGAFEGQGDDPRQDIEQRLAGGFRVAQQCVTCDVPRSRMLEIPLGLDMRRQEQRHCRCSR